MISDPDRYGVTVPCKTHVRVLPPGLMGFKGPSVLPDTTREKRKPESEGVDYHFLSVHEFEESILSNRYGATAVTTSASLSYHLSILQSFIEYGRYGGHYYGTSVDSVRKVMAEGKVCLLDVHPSVSERQKCTSSSGR